MAEAISISVIKDVYALCILALNSTFLILYCTEQGSCDLAEVYSAKNSTSVSPLTAKMGSSLVLSW